MVWQIVKKEILSNLMTLRFALITTLLLVLMAMNALIYAFGLSGYASEMDDYTRRTAGSSSWIEKFSDRGLGELAMAGPGGIPRLPRRLKFCAHGNDELIPRRVSMKQSMTRSRGGRKDVEGYAWREMWVLSYPSSTFGSSMQKAVEIDWVFIGIIVSFGAILLTFDAISGEVERGTLRLMLSHSMSRAHVLLGKFFGVLLTMLLPLLVGILSNLLIITVSGAIPLDNSDWIRIGGIVVLFALYISIFIFIGIFVSSRVSRSITSLSILLLSWVFLAFLLPNLVGLFVCNLKQIPSFEEFSLRKETLLKSIEDKYGPSSFDVGRLLQAPSSQNPAVTRQWAQYLTEQVDTRTRMNDQHLDEQIRQVQLARTVTLISPVAIFQYAMEALAGTGIESYVSFTKQARRYRQEFIDFIKSEDRSDPSSLHIYFVREGLSQKPVKPETVPRFKERITYRSAYYHIAVLVFFVLLFFLAAHISFLRCDIR